MTDREPDDLYDALRDRLADYGQEPPAPLWAGIRAQLPPPVAAPQLRPKRRASVVLLLLLLATASGAGWHWWQGHKATTGPASQLATATDNAPLPAKTKLVTRTTPLLPAGKHLQPDAEQLQTHSDRLPISSGQSVADSGPLLTDGEALAASSERLQPGAGRRSAAGRLPLDSGQLARKNAPATSTARALAALNQPRDLTRRPAPLPDRTSSSEARRHLNDGRMATATALAAGAPAGRSAATPLAATSGAEAEKPTPNEMPMAAEATAGRLARPAAKEADNPTAARTSTAHATPEAATRRGRTTHALAGTARSRAAQSATNKQARKARRATPELETARTATMATAAARAVGRPARGAALADVPPASRPLAAATSLAATSDDESTAPIAEGLARQPGRAVALMLAAGPEPAAPQPVAIVPTEPAATLLPRWAVQVLAGPALTYRQLSSPDLSNNSPMGTPTPTSVTFANASGVAELERPALGSGAQVNVRRSLTERWTLSAGLGYAEYATRLALVQTRTTTTATIGNSVLPSPDSTATRIHRRDTYRFVTVPLRVGYAWPLTSRWQVGVLGGADVAFYAGGSSTEGSACACQTQTWSATNSPYRRVSLGASLGAEVRYRLNGRWELLAQPTATYLLTPLAPATTAYYRRHLLGGTALLGAAYTLP